MATSADLSWEENLVAHWMSDASRAGVILNPMFPNLKITRANSFENASLDLATNSPHNSSSTSLSEDSLHKGQAFRPSSPCEDMLDTSNILFPKSLAKKDIMPVVQDSPDPPIALQTGLECGKLDTLDEKCCTDLLLHKLEQLKGLQQHKQEQLRRQQMDQIQRLMEDQQKLLSMVSEQHTQIGFAVTEDGMNQRYIQPPRLSSMPYLSPRCHDDSAHLDSAAYISSPVEQRDFLEKFKNGQVLKGSLSEKESLDMPFKVQDDLEIEDQNAITGRSNLSPEQSLLGCENDDDSCKGKVYVESSKSLTEGKCLDSLHAEERPILATIPERKQTFEEFLEEQIRLEEQRLSQKGNLKDAGISTFHKPVAKRPFLKRGEGLIRFTNSKSKIAKAKDRKVTFNPDISEGNSLVKVKKPQLHRKTAPSNKDQVSDNFVSKNANLNAKTKKGFTARKTTLLRNCTAKGIPLSTRENSNERKPGEQRKSVRSQINDEKENNKENIMALAVFNEMDLLPGEKPEQPLEPTRCLTNSFEKDPDFSFELSFQRKLENWETEKERENNELDEFLFLEQAADEISFASNSSLIVRILDQGQQISTGHRLSSTPVKSRHEQMHVLDITAVNSRNGEHCEQDNSEKTRGCQARETFRNHQTKADSKILQTFPTEEFQGFSSWNDEDTSDRNSDTTSESEEEFETTIKPVSERVKKLDFNNRGNVPEFSECEDKAEDINKEASPALQEKGLCSDKANETNRAPMSEDIYCANSIIEFDDETSWSDFEENGNRCNEVENSDLVIQVPLSSDGSAKNESVFPDKVIKRKIAMVKKGDVVTKQSVTDSEVMAPPTTDLMLKLFPSLKPRQKVDAEPKHDAKPRIAPEESGGDSARSQLLKEKLSELEMEIEKFRVENASLTKLREERENAMENLRKQIEDFEQQKIKELAQIEEFKKEETRKLQKERKVFEKYAQAARAIPDKKERDEIQALKQQMTALQGDLKRREAKWSTTHMRLRDQIEALTKENMQLREEIKIMERCRLEAWKRKEASANKKKADGCSYTKRTESIHPSAILQKSQTFSSVHQTEKNSKTNGKSDSSTEGRPLAKPKPAAAHNESSLDNTTKPSEDSSKTFMVISKNLPATGMVDSAPGITSDSSDSEDGMVEREATHPDGKVEKVFKNGCHLIIFPNGTRKEVSCDGKITTVSFFNGDIKQILEDQRVVYYYADAKTTHTTYPTGLEVLHFSNGQIEKHFPDGRKEIVFPDQTIKNVLTDGREVNIFPDGTTVRIQQDGSRIIEFSNGQQEIHTAHFKRREYPDGTIKTVYADGRQETQYASGRVRVKDKDGHVIMDTVP